MCLRVWSEVYLRKWMWSECFWECVNVNCKECVNVNACISVKWMYLRMCECEWKRKCTCVLSLSLSPPHPGIVIFSTDASISPTTSFSVKISFSHLREISKIVQATGDQSLPSKFDQLGSRKIPNGIWICSVPLNVDFFELVLNCFCKLYLSDNKKIRLLAPLHVWAIW